MPIIGPNTVVFEEARIADDATIGANCVVEPGAVIGRGSFVDSGTIVRSSARVGENSFIGSNCIIGEYLNEYCRNRSYQSSLLSIGKGALIRSGTILYAGSSIGSNFQTGHRVTVREGSAVGNHVSLGTLCDVQGDCHIGSYVRLHSNVHVGMKTTIDDYVWVFPYVVFTNDPTPPSENLLGVHVESFAIVATGSLLMPGVTVGSDSLVAAGAVVTRDVPRYAIAMGSPAKVRGDVRTIQNKLTSEPAYPWRLHFNRNMPWEEKGYEAWLASLDADARRRIEALTEGCPYEH